MELVKSLLHPAAPKDVSASTALQARFSDDHIRDAFLLLAKMGLVALSTSSGGGGNRINEPVEASQTTGARVELSERFISETEPLFIPRHVFPEAKATIEDLANRRCIDATQATDVGPSHATTSNTGSMVCGLSSPSAGAVAAVLALYSAGTVRLTLEVPPVTCRHSLPTDDSDTAKDELLHLFSEIRVKTTIVSPAARAQQLSHLEEREKADDDGGGGGSCFALESPPTSTHVGNKPEILCQPSRVGACPTVRRAAEKACKKVFTTRKIAGGAPGILHAILQKLRESGADGLSRVSFEAALASLEPSVSEAEVAAAAETLCRWGLARKIAGYDENRLVAAEASQGLVVFPPPPQTNANAKSLDEALAPLALPPAGTPQPLADIPIRPWIDHQGHLNTKFWTDLTRRAVCTAMHCPGIAGNVLLQSLRVVSPQNGREVLGALCEAGVLRAELSLPSPPGNSTSVFAACFGDDVTCGRGRGGGCLVDCNAVLEGKAAAPAVTYGSASFWGEGGKWGDGAWHFFVEPDTCWQLSDV